MVLIDNAQETYKIGSKAIDFSLPGIDGNTYSLSSFQSAKVLIVVFTCNHCPYAQEYAPRLIQIQKDYARRGVQLVGINPNDAKEYPGDSFENMKAYAKKIGMNFSYLRDETQETAKAYHAVCTPDIFVFDEKRKLRYRGKVDDARPYDKPETITEHWLRGAIYYALEGKSPKVSFRPVIGCSIKWLPQNNPN